MQKRENKFHKVSFRLFQESYKEDNKFLQEEIKNIYDDIKLPKRATSSSAGYDFYSPYSFKLEPKETIKIATGIRVSMEDDLVLLIFPRSSLGFKYRLMLENTVGVIDSDYFLSDNECHIFVKITNHSNKTLEIKKGDAFVQGIFIKYYTTIDDDTNEIRNGGIGSTNK